MTCGEHQLNIEEDFQIDLPVTEVVVHPNYKTAPEGFDIAVYKVRLSIANNDIKLASLNSYVVIDGYNTQTTAKVLQ